MNEVSREVDAFFEARGWTPFAFQRETWEAWRTCGSGLIHVPTGSGKTIAALGGPALDALATAASGAPETSGRLRLLWITPLRALAADTAEAVREFFAGVGLDWRVELRTGDTSSSRRQRQRTNPPEVLITTPESATILTSWADHPRFFAQLEGVVVDEWHELLGSKRGTQTELLLARLRALRPELRTWGISATLANLDEACAALIGPTRRGRIIDAGREALAGPIEVETLVPAEATRFPWAGHLGLSLLDAVLDELDAPGTALLFTNTRSQVELWHDALIQARPDWSGDILLHHGSMDRALRDEAEDRLRAGTVRCVVCTSTLDLGVDFAPVDRVIQVGSPKGIARLLQRAGRSGHHPGGVRRIVCVPTHAFEIVEFAAARAALGAGQVEPRHALVAPLDVLAQHMVTRALGGGFEATELFDEVRTTWAYRDLSDARFEAALDFVTRGGAALEAYPRYHRVAEEGGLHRVSDRTIARRHRMTIGTITDEGQVRVRFTRGRTIGHVEESFVSRLRPGDRFLFAGRELELVRFRDMEAWVRAARRTGRRRPVPRWLGGRLPLSTQLAGQVAAALSDGASFRDHEHAAVAPLLDVQRRWSCLPSPETLLIERHRSREGHHLFAFAFLGRLAHEGLATLIAHRLTRLEPRSVLVSANDYGFELLSPDPLPSEETTWRTLLSPEHLAADLLECLNTTELARRRFRDIARIAGLVFPGYPGKDKTARQLQASSGLIFDVLDRWDPDHVLLEQARTEVLDDELAFRRLQAGLERIATLRWEWQSPPRLTPLAFPIWAERVQATVSSESWLDRVRRAARELEEAAG
jgi:ATP-dependent Lhr-like helicase